MRRVRAMGRPLPTDLVHHSLRLRLNNQMFQREVELGDWNALSSFRGVESSLSTG